MVFQRECLIIDFVLLTAVFPHGDRVTTWYSYTRNG
jgi:hypothetical protein